MLGQLTTALLLTCALAILPGDTFKTFEELVNDNGFRSESYNVTTTDGYILSLYRIPGAINEESDTVRPAVLLVHGQECDMMEWLWNTEDKSNALMLARAGYDVWLGNNRGNQYSNTHVSLTVADNAYWEFYQ